MKASDVKIQTHFKKTKFALALSLALYSSFLIAEDNDATMPAEATTLQASDQLQDYAPQPLVDPDATTVTWPLISGESVEGLAQSFYPNNKNMQRRFVTKTLQLSREVHPNLDPKFKSNQASFIIIPNIKSFGKIGGNIKSAPAKKLKRTQRDGQPRLHLSYGLKDAAKFAITAEMQAIYEALVKKNAYLKAELEKLNIKLAKLQDTLGALKEEAVRVINRKGKAGEAVKNGTSISIADLAVIPPAVTPTPVAQEIHAKETLMPTVATSAAAPPPAIQPPAEVVPAAKPKEVVAAVQVESPAPIVEKPAAQILANIQSVTSQYWPMPILPVLLGLIATILGLVYFKRRQDKKLEIPAQEDFVQLEQEDFVNSDDFVAQRAFSKQELDFDLDPYTSGVSVVDSNDISHDDEQSKHKDEGMQILDQAKVYVDFNRKNEAIGLLKAQIKLKPKESLHHWLFLLDIYRTYNQKEDFTLYAQHLHQSFNVAMPLWDEEATLNATSLESFTHIMGRLTKFWADGEKSEETKAYLDELLVDTREGQRVGFSMSVFQEIMLLRNMLDIRDRLNLDS